MFGIDMKIEYPVGSGNFREIKHPRITTLDFQCPTCHVAVDVWCKDPNIICDKRKRLYSIAIDRYFKAILERKVNPPMCAESEERLKKEIIDQVVKESENNSIQFDENSKWIFEPCP